jgi:hypothetical protein
VSARGSAAVCGIPLQIEAPNWGLALARHGRSPDRRYLNTWKVARYSTVIIVGLYPQLGMSSPSWAGSGSRPGQPAVGTASLIKELCHKPHLGCPLRMHRSFAG